MKPLEDRTKAFALDVVRLCSTLPAKPEVAVMTRQLMRSATSVGANYRAACRAQSRAAFIAKLSIVEEEADESTYWMELLEAILPERSMALKKLQKEASELVAIIVTSKKTARRNA